MDFYFSYDPLYLDDLLSSILNPKSYNHAVENPLKRFVQATIKGVTANSTFISLNPYWTIFSFRVYAEEDFEVRFQKKLLLRP